MSFCRKNSSAADRETQSDKLVLLYHQSHPAVYYSLITAFLFAGAMWSHVNNTWLLIWLGFIGIASTIRLVLFQIYQRRKPAGDEILDWERPYAFSLVFSSLVWGAGTVLVTYSSELLYQVVTYFILIGMAGSALSVYSALRYLAITTIATVLLPVTVWFLVQGEQLTVIMAAGGIVFLTSAFRATRVLSSTLHKTFLLTHELTKAKNSAEHLARTDVLTGLYNRRAFSELAEMQIKYCQRHGHPVSILVLDLDHFKNINDSYGHSSGDMA